MSKLLERPTVRTRPAPAPARRRTARPNPNLRGNQPVLRRRPTPRRKPNQGITVQAVGMVFGTCLLMSFVVSSMVGNAMLERARKDRISSSIRHEAVRSEIAQLRKELDSMSGMQIVDRFAESQAMVLSGVPAPTKPEVPSSADTRVAMRAANER